MFLTIALIIASFLMGIFAAACFDMWITQHLEGQHRKSHFRRDVDVALEIVKKDKEN